MSLKTFSPFKVGGVVGCTTSSAGLTLVLATVVYRNRLTLGEAGVGEKCGLLLLLGLLQLFVIVILSVEWQRLYVADGLRCFLFLSIGSGSIHCAGIRVLSGPKCPIGIPFTIATWVDGIWICIGCI